MAGLPEEDITFACQECGKSIALPAYYAGRVGDCPECGSYVDVPRESEQPSDAETGVASVKSLDPSERTTAQLWFEVLAVLCLAYVPWVWRTIHVTGAAPSSGNRTVYGLFYLLVDALQVSLPLLVIIALSGERWASFGIVRPKLGRDIIIGCVIWLGGRICRVSVISLLPLSILKMHHPTHAAHRSVAEGVPECALLLAICVINTFAQELVYRGYLIPRFERLLRSTWLAVLVSAVLFGSFHLYQGVVSAIIITAGAMVYGVAFCLLRRLWPLCVAHTLNNFLLWI